MDYKQRGSVDYKRQTLSEEGMDGKHQAWPQNGAPLRVQGSRCQPLPSCLSLTPVERFDQRHSNAPPAAPQLTPVERLDQRHVLARALAAFKHPVHTALVAKYLQGVGTSQSDCL